MEKLKNLISFIEQEIEWHREHSDEYPEGTFSDGFLAGLRQVRDYGIPLVESQSDPQERAAEPTGRTPKGERGEP